MTSTATVEGIIEIAKSIQQRAEQHLVEDGFVTPLAFLFLRKDPETGEVFLEPELFIFMPERMSNSREKEVYANCLHDVIKAGNGVAILNLMECWTADGSQEEILGWLAEHDSFEDYPARKEKVSLSLEHQDLHGGVVWMAEILRPDGEAPRLGPWINEEYDEATGGRFFGFFNESASA